MTAAAIAAQLVDVRNVGTHKVVKLTLHVAEEHAMQVMQAFGWPTMVAPVPVAIARLAPQYDSTQAATEAQPRSAQHPPPEPTGGSRKKFNELHYAAQAALRGDDPIYRAFLREMCGRPARDAEDAAEDIRDLCGVESRKDIRPDTVAEKSWLELERMFSAWTAKERVGA